MPDQIKRDYKHVLIFYKTGYFDKDIVLHSFVQGKKFCNFVFSFICMIYKWGGDFIGGNFLRGGFSQEAIFSGEKCWGVIFRGEFS